MPHWIDSHSHLADPRWGSMLESALTRSRGAGVSAWIQGGVNPEDWARQRALRARLGPALILSFGLHPWWVITRSREELEGDLAQLESALPNAQALGELGLDFSKKLPAAHSSIQDPRAHQLWAFDAQLALAEKTGKPLVLHIVRAHDLALARLTGRRRDFRGIVHSFSGDRSQAGKYLDLGLSLSISGAIARKGFSSLKEAVKFIPSERLLVETDCPDQPLQPAGAGAEAVLNEPACLIAIAEAIASLRGERTDAVLDRSAENARRIF